MKLNSVDITSESTLMPRLSETAINCEKPLIIALIEKVWWAYGTGRRRMLFIIHGMLT